MMLPNTARSQQPLGFCVPQSRQSGRASPAFAQKQLWRDRCPPSAALLRRTGAPPSPPAPVAELGLGISMRILKTVLLLLLLMGVGGCMTFNTVEFAKGRTHTDTNG